MNCHTSELSEDVCFHLQPTVKKIPSYAKQITDLLEAIKSDQDDAYLVSFDVKSWYTSMPNAEEIKAITESLDKNTSKNVVTKVIRKFLTLIFTLHNFVLNC